MANMFRCVLASGGALILTVTTDSSFAGQTITCTDGTTTLTQICPSTSPYTVEFKIPNGGTWTISSGTASTSVVIPDSIELHDIPNGSTITPINDIQIWLHCANIWDKSYTTITQVLNDASTLQALISSNNAADYMARSTTWASSVTANQTAMSYIGLNNYCANKLLANSTWRTAICSSTYFESVLNVKVPTMTSNTTPSGVASSSGVYSTGYEAWRSFVGVDKSTAMMAGSGANAWLQYKFTNAVNIAKVTIKEYNNPSGVAINALIKDITFKVSNDGTNWTNVGTASVTNVTQGKEYSFNINYSGKYTYFRVTASNNNGQSSYTQFGREQYYGRA